MYRSLCIVALFAFGVSSLTIRELPPADPAEVKCRAANNITPEIMSGLDANPETAFENPKTRCYATCYLTETKILKPDGTLNVEFVIDEILPAVYPYRAKIVQALNDCANQQGANNCETAFNTATCLRNKEFYRDLIVHISK